VLHGMHAAPDTGLALETKAIELLLSSRDQKEGMAAFLEKRKSKFNGK
jgi:enoyl-CoA hydratase